MPEWVISLMGVVMGGIITLFTTWFSEHMRGKEERRKKELEVLGVVILHYNIFWGKIRNETYWNNHLGDAIEFYYGDFSEMRLNNKSNELLYLSMEKRVFIDKIDNNIYKWIREAEENNLVSLPMLSKELRLDIEKLAILCK